MDTHVDELVFQPKRHFDKPEEVLKNRKLSSDDKVRILESWKLDSQRLADSTAENMDGGEDCDLREVSRALIQLKEMEKPAVAIQRKNNAAVMSGLVIGSALGAGVGLVATVATATASLALIAQTTVAGLIVGGVAGVLKRPLR
jgi:hypothetical protein